MKIPRLVTMLLAGMLLACSTSFAVASDTELTRRNEMLTTMLRSAADDKTGYYRVSPIEEELPLAFYDRVRSLACTFYYIEIRFRSAQDLEASVDDLPGWLDAIIGSSEYPGCYRLGFEVCFTQLTGDDTVTIFGQNVNLLPDLPQDVSSSAAFSESSAAPSASSTMLSDEIAMMEHELRRKDLPIVHPRNSTEPHHVMDAKASSTTTVDAASLIPTGTTLATTAHFDINHSRDGENLNFPSQPDYNSSNHLSISVVHCSLNAQLSITAGGWQSDRLGWLNVTITDFVNNLDMRLQGNDSGEMTFPLASNSDADRTHMTTAISLPGLGKAAIVFEAFFDISWNFSDATTINYSPGGEWQEHPTYVYFDFANQSASHFAYHPLAGEGPGTQRRQPGPFNSRSDGAMHLASGNLTLALRTTLGVFFIDDSAPNTIAAQAALSFTLPSSSASLAALPIADFDRACGGAAAYPLWGDARTAANFSASYPTMVRFAKHDAGVAAASMPAPFAWLDAGDQRALQMGWDEQQYAAGYDDDVACYVWHKEPAWFCEAGYILELANASVRDADAAAAASADGEGAGAKKGGAGAEKPRVGPAVAMGLVLGGAVLGFF